ncbi:MAG: hypothetical protein KAS32_28265, partial [Candidatus Peribacteraceae bacterium]|nr:hypothetical protein [Candidatus Peribacteraceae bacterium]
MRKILWIIVLVFILPSVVMAQYSDVATGGNGGANDSIGVDTDDDGTFESYLYPAFLQKGSNITLTVAGDTLTIAGPASGGTADSMGVDTDGDGTVDNYLYSTTVGAFHLKKGTNITMTVAGDTVEIAGPSASGTADSMGVDTDGDGTMDNYLYSTVAGAFHLTEKTGMTLLVQGDTLLLSTTLGTTILSNEIFDQTIIKDDIDSTASNVVFDNAYEGTSAEADSQYSTHNWVQVEIGDSLGGYIDSASIHDSLDVVRAEMGDSATTVRLDEIQDPSGDKTFTMGTNDLEFSYTAPTTNAFEINLAGGFSGDGFHVHQHTGNPGTTNMVV